MQYKIYALALPFDLRCESGTYKFTNTFDYPILSNVTLTCMVTPTPPTNATYQWNTTTGQTTQNVTGNNLLAEDTGTITCTTTIGGDDYTSGPLTLRISGVLSMHAIIIII